MAVTFVAIALAGLEIRTNDAIVVMIPGRNASQNRAELLNVSLGKLGRASMVLFDHRDQTNQMLGGGKPTYGFYRPNSFSTASISTPHQYSTSRPPLPLARFCPLDRRTALYLLNSKYSTIVG